MLVWLPGRCAFTVLGRSNVTGKSPKVMLSTLVHRGFTQYQCSCGFLGVAPLVLGRSNVAGKSPKVAGSCGKVAGRSPKSRRMVVGRSSEGRLRSLDVAEKSPLAHSWLSVGVDPSHLPRNVAEQTSLLREPHHFLIASFSRELAQDLGFQSPFHLILLVPDGCASTIFYGMAAKLLQS